MGLPFPPPPSSQDLVPRRGQVGQRKWNFRVLGVTGGLKGFPPVQFSLLRKYFRQEGRVGPCLGLPCSS